MAFSLSSRKISVSSDGVLTAECQTKNDTWNNSSLNLNEWLGNNNGSFELGSGAFSKSASNLVYENSFLTATLSTINSGSVTRTICLDTFVSNDDGELSFARGVLSEWILLCGMISLEGSVLSALCLAKDGTFKYSTINLNDHYANDDGEFESDDGGFFGTAQNVRLEVGSKELWLCAELKDKNDKWCNARKDLSPCILNRNGILIFERHDHWFDRDGWATRFLEKVPVVGFVVAGGHLLAGNTEWAIRAASLCANYTVVAIGMVIGALLGGVAGGAIGAALATPLGIAVESLAKHKISDPQVKKDFEEATIGRVLYETLRNLVSAYAAGAIAKHLGTAAAEALINQLTEEVTKKTVTVVTEVSFYFLFKKICDAIAKDEAQYLLGDWSAAEEKVTEEKA